LSRVREGALTMVEAMQKPKATKAPKRRSRHEPAAPGQLLLFKPQVTALLGVGYTTLWDWMRQGRFPRAVELGPPGGRSTMIAWYSHEIDDWIRSRPRRQFGQHDFRGARAGDALSPETTHQAIRLRLKRGEN
jgi:predicted DNA-binding transcriptional regulator AlpA